MPIRDRNIDPSAFSKVRIFQSVDAALAAGVYGMMTLVADLDGEALPCFQPCRLVAWKVINSGGTTGEAGVFELVMTLQFATTRSAAFSDVHSTSVLGGGTGAARIRGAWAPNQLITLFGDTSEDTPTSALVDRTTGLAAIGNDLARGHWYRVNVNALTAGATPVVNVIHQLEWEHLS